MNGLPRQKLVELAARRHDVVRDHKLCKALLLDSYGQYRGEVRVLVMAVEEGVATELLDNSAGCPAQALIARLSKRLHDNCRVVEADARWAVESWALALGVAKAAGISPENAARTPPAVGVKQNGLASAPSQPPRVPDDHRVSCPACGRMLRVDGKSAGQQLPCPTCKALLRVSVDGRGLELAPSNVVAPGHSPTPRAGKEIAVDLGAGVKLELVLIPAGSFMMGDESGSPCEKPVHKVTLTKPFYMAKYVVTQEQWEAVMGGNASHFKGREEAGG